jgi:hypothetical protein
MWHGHPASRRRDARDLEDATDPTANRDIRLDEVE